MQASGIFKEQTLRKTGRLPLHDTQVKQKGNTTHQVKDITAHCYFHPHPPKQTHLPDLTKASASQKKKTFDL